MKESLSKRVGPLPAWAWILIAGGTIGVVVLVKRSKAKPKEGTEAIPEHLAIPGVEGSGGGAGGGPGEVKTPTPEVQAAASPTAPGSISGTPVAEFLMTEHELQEGGWERHVAAPTGSAAPAVAAAHKAANGGAPGRGGLPFKSSSYKGHTAHEYGRAVPGGVGPGKRFVILPVGRKNHAAKGQHQPAHAKDHPSHHAAAKPRAPVVHHHAPAKRAPARRPPPKRKRR